MIVVPNTSEEMIEFCHWLDVNQSDPVAFSCFRKLEVSEHKDFVFWLMDGKQFIMVNREFPFPEGEEIMTLQKFFDTIEENRNQYRYLFAS